VIGVTGHAFVRWCERVAHVAPEGPDAPAARAALWALLPELIEQGPDPSGLRTVWIHPAHPGLAFIVSRDVDARAGCRVLVTVAPLVSGRGTAHIGKGPGRTSVDRWDRDSGRRERGGHWRPSTEDARLERVRVAVERQRERGRRTGRIGR
jgi:hypothetical protein